MESVVVYLVHRMRAMRGDGNAVEGVTSSRGLTKSPRKGNTPGKKKRGKSFLPSSSSSSPSHARVNKERFAYQLL